MNFCTKEMDVCANTICAKMIEQKLPKEIIVEIQQKEKRAKKEKDKGQKNPKEEKKLWE